MFSIHDQQNSLTKSNYILYAPKGRELYLLISPAADTIPPPPEELAPKPKDKKLFSRC